MTDQTTISIRLLCSVAGLGHRGTLHEVAPDHAAELIRADAAVVESSDLAGAGDEVDAADAGADAGGDAPNKVATSVTPKAAELAEQYGLDPFQIETEDGKVGAEDVRRAAATRSDEE